jgi:hypothetical protein
VKPKKVLYLLVILGIAQVVGDLVGGVGGGIDLGIVDLIIQVIVQLVAFILDMDQTDKVGLGV